MVYVKDRFREIHLCQSENEYDFQQLQVRIYSCNCMEEYDYVVIIQDGEYGEFRRGYDSDMCEVGNTPTSPLIGSLYDIFRDVRLTYGDIAAGKMRSDPSVPTREEIEKSIAGGSDDWGRESIMSIALIIADCVNDYGD